MGATFLRILLLSLSLGIANFARAIPVTYDFTGVVIETMGIFNMFPSGTPVSGTYTFDFSVATSSSGTIGPFADWSVESNSPASFVFSSAGRIGDFSYSTLSSGFAADSVIRGSSSGALSAAESSLSLAPELFTFRQTSSSLNALYLDSGLPILPPSSVDVPATGSFGYLFPHDANLVFFRITSLTPGAAVPEPFTYALLLVGIAGLAYVTRRRQFAGVLT